MKTIRGWLIDIFALERALGLPPASNPKTGAIPPVRAAHPCGVRDCFEPQVIVSQNDHETVVECPVHECRTNWETTAREDRPQTIIRVQDNWHQHGTKGQPPR